MPVIEQQKDLQYQQEFLTHEPPPAKPRRYWIAAAIILALVVVFIFRVLTRNQSQQADEAVRANQQSIPVSVVVAKREDIPVYLNGLGTVQSFNTVTVTTRVDGQLTKIAFQEGQIVQQGNSFAQIDPRPFQVQLEQAEGQLAKDEAQLNNAKVDLARYQVLIQQDSIPKQQLDTQAALVAQLESTIKSDQAAIDSAKLQLTYCRITAPITGRAGLRSVDVGNIVHATDPNGLVVITQVQPISVLFALPEDSLPPLLKKLQAKEHIDVDAFDRSGSTRVASGSLNSIDNQIDSTTGTLRMKAVFENRDNALFPNQFVNIKLLLDVKRNSVIVPAAAIQSGPKGNFVFVVNSNNTVGIRQITSGVTTDTKVSIDRGLGGGEKVVIDGAEKLREGSKVRVTNFEGRKTQP